MPRGLEFSFQYICVILLQKRSIAFPSDIVCISNGILDCKVFFSRICLKHNTKVSTYYGPITPDTI